MDSLNFPEDIEILKVLLRPKNKYEVHKQVSPWSYPTIIRKINKLEKEGLIFCTREEQRHGLWKSKYYLITAKGRAVLRGFEEAERRE